MIYNLTLNRLIIEGSFNSNPNISKNSFLKDSRKSTEKQAYL